MMRQMTSQDSPGTVRVTMMSWNTLPRDVLGLKQTMTSQDSPRTVRVTMMSWNTLPRDDEADDIPG